MPLRPQLVQADRAHVRRGLKQAKPEPNLLVEEFANANTTGVDPHLERDEPGIIQRPFHRLLTKEAHDEGHELTQEHEGFTYLIRREELEYDRGGKYTDPEHEREAEDEENELAENHEATRGGVGHEPEEAECSRGRDVYQGSTKHYVVVRVRVRVCVCLFNTGVYTFLL